MLRRIKIQAIVIIIIIIPSEIFPPTLADDYLLEFEWL